MYKPSFKKLFYNPENKAKLLELLHQTSSNTKIARHFNCDHSTIYYWRSLLAPETVRKGVRINLKSPVVPKKASKTTPYIRSRGRNKLPETYKVGGEIYRTGKNYADYVAIEKRKKEEVKKFEELSRL